ncbi:hypothetical protein EU537_11615 [Candidatus Thorarchaeota archaeon]|nr:MAG: hypothetical protein EU537_11615 [Candidatus Thorarchaeota archaeon]
MQRREEIRPSTIAEEMDVSRPYVSQAHRIAEERIEQLLIHASSVLRVDLDHLDTSYGIAVGYCSALKSAVYFTYSPEIGVQTWYRHEGDCSGCDKYEECEAILYQLSKEWDIDLPVGLPPTEKGAFLFDAIMGELEWEIRI